MSAKMGRLSGLDFLADWCPLLPNREGSFVCSQRYRPIRHLRSTLLCYGYIHHRVNGRQNSSCVGTSGVGIGVSSERVNSSEERNSCACLVVVGAVSYMVRAKFLGNCSLHCLVEKQGLRIGWLSPLVARKGRTLLSSPALWTRQLGNTIWWSHT